MNKQNSEDYVRLNDVKGLFKNRKKFKLDLDKRQRINYHLDKLPVYSQQGKTYDVTKPKESKSLLEVTNNKASPVDTNQSQMDKSSKRDEQFVPLSDKPLSSSDEEIENKKRKFLSRIKNYTENAEVHHKFEGDFKEIIELIRSKMQEEFELWKKECRDIWIKKGQEELKSSIAGKEEIGK